MALPRRRETPSRTTEARARIARENAQLPTDEPPKRKKTLAELEAANAELSLQSDSVVSLYAQ